MVPSSHNPFLFKISANRDRPFDWGVLEAWRMGDLRALQCRGHPVFALGTIERCSDPGMKGYENALRFHKMFADASGKIVNPF